MGEERKRLTVNCGLACLLSDRENILDNYDQVTINSGKVIVSSAIYSKLSAKGANINSGDLRIRDIKGEIIQLDNGAVIDTNTSLKDLFAIAMDNVLVKKGGIKALEEAEGLIALGTIYYPESSDLSSLIKAAGEKKPYPDDAQIILGDHQLESIAANIRGPSHIWVSGRVTALEKSPLEKLKAQKCTISCGRFFTYEGLNSEYGDLVNCASRILVPDGYEITAKIREGELAVHEKKLYVDGSFTMNEEDIPALEELEGIIVKGKASLPSSASKIFRSKGKADEYFIYEGRLIEVNGLEQFSHSQLVSASGKTKLTFLVNGCLFFDDDVTPEDIDNIASIYYNGAVLISGPAKSELGRKVKTGNGFMGDPALMEERAGISIKDFLSQKDPDDPNSSSINIGTYILA